MLVGATGLGKYTLVDGFVNYVMGVSFDDPFQIQACAAGGGGKKDS